MKKRTIGRLICLMMAMLLLLPLALPASAATEGYSFGVVTDNQRHTLVGVAVKNNSDVLVYTSSQEQIKVGTKGSFSIDGETETAVVLSSTEVGGAIQCWKATEETGIASTLHEIAKPIENMDAAALYLAYGQSSELVKRQTPVTVSQIIGDLALAIHLKDKPSEKLSGKAFGLGLLLDSSGKAVGILCGTDAAICPWYSDTETPCSSGTIQQGDSKLASDGVRSIVDLNAVQNPMLLQVSAYYSAFARAFISDSDIDYCTAIDSIAYRDNGVRPLTNGKKIADGDGNSLKGSFSKGGGAGVDDDSYWYFSLTFPADIAQNVISLNAIALISGAEYSDAGSGSDEREAVNKAADILEMLLADGISTAVTSGELTYFFVNTGTQYIIGVDSENYFRYCNTSITNFKTME